MGRLWTAITWAFVAASLIVGSTAMAINLATYRAIARCVTPQEKAH